MITQIHTYNDIHTYTDRFADRQMAIRINKQLQTVIHATKQTERQVDTDTCRYKCIQTYIPAYIERQTYVPYIPCHTIPHHTRPTQTIHHRPTYHNKPSRQTV